MIIRIIISSLIVLGVLFLSLLIKRYIKEELKVIKPFCKLINITILITLTAFLILNLNNIYVLIFIVIGFVLQRYIKTRFFSIPLHLITTLFMFFSSYSGILIGFVAGLFINLIIKDFRELMKEKWHSI